jgi:hypothetical protein
MAQNHFHTSTDTALSSWSEHLLTDEQLDAILSKDTIYLDSLLDVPVSTSSSA